MDLDELDPVDSTEFLKYPSDPSDLVEWIWMNILRIFHNTLFSCRFQKSGRCVCFETVIAHLVSKEVVLIELINVGKYLK